MAHSARLGNKTVLMPAVMHVRAQGSRGEEVITGNISDISCGQSMGVMLETTSSWDAA